MHQTLSYDVKCMGYTGGGSGIPDQVGPVPTKYVMVRRRYDEVRWWYARYAGGTPALIPLGDLQKYPLGDSVGPWPVGPIQLSLLSVVKLCVCDSLTCK